MIYRMMIAAIVLVQAMGLIHADGFETISVSNAWSPDPKHAQWKDSLSDDWGNLVLDQGAKAIAKPAVDGWSKVAPGALAKEFQWQPQVNAGNPAKAGGTGVFIHEIYKPSQVQPGNDPLAIILIHGTWSRANEMQYMSEEKEDVKSLLPDVKRFARLAAELNKAPAHILTFGWTGQENDKARMTAGLYLAELINTHFAHHRVFTIAHSHGGNVVNYASHMLKKPLGLAVHIGTPIIQRGKYEFCPEYRPMNMELLLNFYSTGDSIQWAGGNNVRASAVQLTKQAASFIGDKFAAFKREAKVGLSNILHGNFANVQARYENAWVNPQQPQQHEMQDLSVAHPDDYRYGFVNMWDSHRKIRMGYEEKRNNNVGRIVNIRLQAHGRIDPDHGMLKQYVIQTLWEVRAQKLPNYMLSDDLDLNVDGSQKEHRVILAIRNMPEIQPGWDELQYDKYQKELFKSMYGGKDITDKGGIFSRILTHAGNACRYVPGLKDLAEKFSPYNYSNSFLEDAQI